MTKTTTPPDPAAVAVAAEAKAAATEALQAMPARRAQLERDELAAVAAARALKPKPMTWDEIADALGTSRPYACRRFGHLLTVTVAPAAPDELARTRRR